MAPGEPGRRRNSIGAISILGWLAAPGAPRHHQRFEHRSLQRRRSTNQGRSSGSYQSEDDIGQEMAFRARSKKKSPREPGRDHSKVQVQLKPLDDRYLTLTLTVSNGLPVSKLESHIRDRYSERDRPIVGPAIFQFYNTVGQELTPNDEITPETPALWYRVARSLGTLEGWKFSLWEDSSDGALDNSLAREMVEAINAGATVGQIREKVAEHMGIQDANRVILVARDGLRRGSLQGNGWELRRVKTWLCRWISIDINPRNGYVVFRGLRREYLYHPKPECISMDLKSLLEYMGSRLFRGVHQHGKGKSAVPYEHAKLSVDGKPVPARKLVRWGATYEFELSDDAAETFSLEESWLLPATETCSTCIEDKTISEMPIKVTARCDHQPTVCRDCMKQWLQSGVEAGRWDNLKCPDCSELLEHHDVKRNASKETFDRYDNLMVRAALKDLAEFRFCLSPTCDSGQMHHSESDCPEFQCVACASRQCVAHNIPWHEGETCAEYDRRNLQRRKDEEASEREVSRTSKTCPQCKKLVHKYMGCNHITCVCGHEWCYVCLAPYQRNVHGFLFCRHAAECTEPRDPLLDMIDPAGIDPLAPFPPELEELEQLELQRRRERRQEEQLPPPPEAPAPAPAELPPPPPAAEPPAPILPQLPPLPPLPPLADLDPNGALFAPQRLRPPPLRNRVHRAPTVRVRTPPDGEALRRDGRRRRRADTDIPVPIPRFFDDIAREAMTG